MQDGLPPPVPPPLPPPRGTVRPASAPRRRRRHVAARARVITAWASVATFAGLALGVSGTSATANSSAVLPPTAVPTTNPAPSPTATDPYPRPAAPPYNRGGSYPPPAASTHGS
jgi:hypothetical protein